MRISRDGLGRRIEYVSSRARNAGANLILHGNIFGEVARHPADFSNFVARQGGRQNSGFPDAWRIDPQIPFGAPARVGVVIHCFYPELLGELYDHLANIPVEFDVVVTNASGEAIPAPEGLANMKNFACFEVDNHGRDIFPLVQLVNAEVLNPYELILKVHTKRSAWREEHTDFNESGDAWKDQFLSDLLGTPERVADILDAFAADHALGLITATGNVVGKKYWGGDQRIVEQLMRRIEMAIGPDALRFAAGSMYWVRGFVLQGLRAFNLVADDFDEEAGQVDGTTAHAIERIIGIVAEEAGLVLAEAGELPAMRKRLGGEGGGQRFAMSAPRTERATIIPFYLPQFHPSEQNDQWWGTGFTEWSNVTGAVPAYRGHYQPKIPTELGFYDLRIDEVRQRQTDLAREHAIAGFMYYYYWFAGQRLLNLPIEKLHASDVDMPYCLMWANENWTRRWDGHEADILIGQDYDTVPAEDFIDDVMDFLADERYIRVDGKPLLAVYRPGQMDNFPEVVVTWRERARAAGVGEIMVLAVAVARDFDSIVGDAFELGLDGTLEFPPHNLPWVAGPASRVGMDHRWRGNFMSYQATAEASIQNARQLERGHYPGAMVAFDNTARRQWKPDVWYGSNPYTFHRWVKELVDAVSDRSQAERIVFINAWNEWAESAILEPTTRYGRSFLLAIRSVVMS